MIARAAAVVLGLLLAGCSGGPEPVAREPVVMAVPAGVPAGVPTGVTAARLDLASALIEARTTRITLLQAAMAAPVDSPQRPTLANRADRLKQLEAVAVAAQKALHAVQDAPGRDAAQTVAEAHDAADRLRALAGRLAP